MEEVFFHRKSRRKYDPKATGATAATLSIRINVLGFPGSAMFSRDAFSDQSAIIFHALMVAPPPLLYMYVPFIPTTTAVHCLLAGEFSPPQYNWCRGRANIIIIHIIHIFGLRVAGLAMYPVYRIYMVYNIFSYTIFYCQSLSRLFFWRCWCISIEIRMNDFWDIKLYVLRILFP